MSTLNQALRTFNQREATQAALQNERVTRARVEGVEQVVISHENRLKECEAKLAHFRSLTFWGRLRWLLWN